MRSLRSFLLDSLILVLLGVGGLVLYQNYNGVLDWYYLRGYTPPAEIAQLSDRATLTEEGEKLFYRARPEIDETRNLLVQHCRVPDEKTIELGCYLSTNKIYLLRINQPDLEPEMVVTAAHETLHAAYSRLDRKERNRLNARLKEVAAQQTRPDLQERLNDYESLEPGEEENELHSILGSEFANLPPDLETHYAQYFSNRAQIVAYSNQFNRNFDGLHKEIVQLESEIKAMRAQMRFYEQNNMISQYNALVPTINTKINRYNAKVEQYNQYADELLGRQPATTTE